jgi:hypothetical protein
VIVQPPDEPELPKVLHVFVTKGRCYDTAGETPPAKGQVRVTVEPEIFDSLDHHKVKQFLTLIHRGVFPVVDISCCSWVDTCDNPKGLFDFLEFVMSRNGTVRFSDFSLRIARDFLKRVGLELDYDLVPDISGTVKIKFDPEDLKSSQLDDLEMLGQLALEGQADIHAMGGTRRMVIKGDLPDHAKTLIHLERPKVVSPTVPALLVLRKPEMTGRVVLFSCHFAEMKNVKGVDPDRVVSAIRLLQGEEAANEFQNRLADARRRGPVFTGQVASAGVGRLMSATGPSSGPMSAQIY